MINKGKIRSVTAETAKREFKRRSEKLKGNKGRKAQGRTPWRLDLGAEVLADGVRFRFWAPKRKRVEVVIEDRDEIIVPLKPERNGYFSRFIPDIGAGALYWYRLDKEGKYPDPCSRFQPEGPHGPSMIVDPWAYRWGDSNWRRVGIRGQVIYELHIGTFTAEGTFDAALCELGELKRIGVTLIEIMPVSEFNGH